MRHSVSRHALLYALLYTPLSVTMVCTAPSAGAQGTASAGSPSTPAHLMGTVTAISDSTLTLQPEGGGSPSVLVTLSPQTRLLRIAPGEKTLQNAAPLALADLAVGDRVLVRGAAQADAAHITATVLIAMKQADISQSHEKASADWRERGISGVVQSIDPAAGTITLRPQAGKPPLVLHTTAATEFRLYAPDSTAFADSHKASMVDIAVGDQMRARGTKDSTGTSLAAEEVVAGSFRNLAGTVTSVDPGAGTLSLLDLATKKPVTLQIETTTQLRRLPPEMALRLAHRGGAGQARPMPTAAHSNAPAGPASPTMPSAAPPSRTMASGDGAQVAGGEPSTTMLLQRAPVIVLGDLKKGDAVMIVSSGPGALKPAAITVIAGVEPLLEGSPDASQNLFSASWNIGGGGDAAGGETTPQR